MVHRSRRPLLLLLSCLAAPLHSGASLTDPDPTPAILWTHLLEDRIAARPAATPTRVAALSRRGHLVVLDARDGKLFWEVDLGEPAEAGPLIWRSRVYVVTSAGSVNTLDLLTGSPAWNLPLHVPVGIPLVIRGDAELLVTGADGSLFSLAPETGHLLGRKRIGAPPKTPPVPCRDRILVGTQDGKLHGLPTGKARGAWEVPCGGGVTSTPTCDGKAVLVGCGDTLYRIGIRKGKVHWKFRTGGRISVRPVIADRRIIVGSYDNDLYILKRKNGHLARILPSTHRITTDPLLLKEFLLLNPHTSGEIRVRPRDLLDPVTTLPLPDPWESDCTSPVAAGRNVVVLGCGSEVTRLIGVRLLPTRPADPHPPASGLQPR